MEQLSTVVIALVSQAPLAAVFAYYAWKADKRAERLEKQLLACMEQKSGIDLPEPDNTPI